MFSFSSLENVAPSKVADAMKSSMRRNTVKMTADGIDVMLEAVHSLQLAKS